MLSSIRARLLAAFALLTLVAIGGMTLAALGILRQRADVHARADFRAAREQLKRSLSLRYQAFHAASDLTYVLPVFRQVAATGDEADFGLSTKQDDDANLKTLHDNLVDADWSWAKTAGDGWVAVADGKGRTLYASAAPKAWGGDARTLQAVARAFDSKSDNVGAMVVDGADGRLQKAGLTSSSGMPGEYVLFARATVLGGKARAVFIQGIRARTLLADLALGESGTALALAMPNGPAEGSVPPTVLAAGRALTDAEAAAVDTADAHWLVQRQPLYDLAGTTVIGDLILARNLDVGLALLLQAGSSLLTVAGVLVLLALGVAMYLATRLSRPVVQLEKAAARVAAGDLTVQVAQMGSDEMGRLAATFNRMIEGLRERDRIKFTFKKYLAPEVVDYLLAHPEAQSPGGERREMTVMFSDLARFTTFAETHPPEEVVEVLNACLTELSGAIAATGGTVDKFIGDNVMAFFGAPIPRPDHALRACKSALIQQKAMGQLAPRFRGGNWPALDIRVGINTGDMIVGTVGGGTGQDYTVIGDAVNLASRLESANKIYGTRILCSEATWLATEGRLAGREVDLLQVQGKQNAVRIFELVAELDDVSAAQAACMAAYAQGLAAYRARSFSEAAGHFDVALQALPTDGPAAVLRGRARAFCIDAPESGWSGVYQATDK